jgi:hypothetical protein
MVLITPEYRDKIKKTFPTRVQVKFSSDKAAPKVQYPDKYTVIFNLWQIETPSELKQLTKEALTKVGAKKSNE